MDRKHHWAWPHFSGRTITRDQHKIHFQQEYAVYVRDFPVFLARIHGKNPPPEVRSLLAGNIYEEETGGLSLGRSHPELFLTMMKGFGYDQAEFRNVALLPASRSYRRWLDSVSARYDQMISLWLTKSRAMDEVLRKYDASSTLPNPEEFGLGTRPVAPVQNRER